MSIHKMEFSKLPWNALSGCGFDFLLAKVMVVYPSITLCQLSTFVGKMTAKQQVILRTNGHRVSHEDQGV